MDLPHAAARVEHWPVSRLERAAPCPQDYRDIMRVAISSVSVDSDADLPTPQARRLSDLFRKNHELY